MGIISVHQCTGLDGVRPDPEFRNRETRQRVRIGRGNEGTRGDVNFAKLSD